MPLVKPSATNPPPTHRTADRAAILAALNGADPDARRSAARACRAFPDGIEVIARRLAEETDPRVVEVLVLNLVAIGGPAAAAALAPLLRSDDAGCRFAATEALQDLGSDALPFFDILVRDPDPQVRILAAEIARGHAGGAAAQTLESLLAEEADVNVCCAYVDVLADIGSVQSAAALRAVKARLPGNAFLTFSVDAALAQLPTD
ncbi:MAG TPA: HEAT repeat domain-containing protein [Azospirillum sp.]